MKKLISIAAICMFCAFTLKAQYIMSTDQEKFAEEIKQLLWSSNNINGLITGEGFEQSWNGFGPDIRNKIIRQTTSMLDSGYKLRPHLDAYFKVISNITNVENADQKVVVDFLNVTEKVLSKNEKKIVLQYFQTMGTFFEKRMLYSSNSNSLLVSNDAYTLEYVEEQIIEEEPYVEESYEDSNDEDEFESWDQEETYDDDDWGTDWEEDTPSYEEENYEEEIALEYTEQEVITRTVLGPVIKFTKADLSIITPYDTGLVSNTSGSFMLLDNVYVGEKGKYDWSSVGLSSDSVYVQINAFEHDVSKTKFYAESVKLTYLGHLKEPILGIFEFKPQQPKSHIRLSYPRFKSLSNKVEVENMGGEYFYYTGGFSLAGRNILSEAKFRGLATIRVDDASGRKFKTRSFRYVFEDSMVVANRSSIVIYNKFDSIYHPAVRIKYDHKSKDLVVQRDDGPFRNTPFMSSLPNMNFTADIIRWNVESDSLYISTLSARSERPLIFQSNEYYDRQDFTDVNGLYDFNPLKLVISYAKKIKSNEFYIDEIALKRNIPFKTIKGAMIDLMQHGYIDFNVISGKLKITERGLHKGKAQSGKSDYDNMLLFSKTANSTNAILDIKTQEIHLNGVDKFFLSKILDVSVTPDSSRITFSADRNIKFHGKLAIGNFDYIGHDFLFRYDSFLVEMNQIDSIQFYVKDENSRGDKRKKVDNTIAGVPSGAKDQNQSDSLALNGDTNSEFVSSSGSTNGSSGILYINKPRNKSGKKMIPNYPKFKGQGVGSVVYFDRDEILNGLYDKSMYFQLPPFDLDSLSDSDPAAIKFAGTLHSNGWFPEFQENLSIMPDYSLGFDHGIPPDGYQLYGGHGRLYNRLTLDKRGLLGHGKLEFLTSTQEADDYIFYVDSVATDGNTFTMHSEVFNGISYPQVTAIDYHMKWLPMKDSMYIYNKETLFSLYGGEAKLDGSLIVTNNGVNGYGHLLSYNSSTISDEYFFNGDDFQAGHSNFEIKSNNPEKAALYGSNVHIDFDILNKQAEIRPEVAGEAAINFPYAQFKTSITKAVWDQAAQKVTMSKPDNVPIADSYFYTTRQDLDSLRFNATYAEYDMNALELKVSGIPYIIVADSKITPEGGEVLILENSRIGTLQNTSIILDTLNEYHQLYDATVTIISRNEFEGEGTYRFINSVQDTFAIKLHDFHLEEFFETRNKRKASQHTVAGGAVAGEDSLLISPGMYYRGNVKLLAHKPALELDGFVKLDLKSIPNYDTWIKYGSEAEQQEVVFEFDKSVTSDGLSLSAGLHFDGKNNNLYSTFCYDKRDQLDFDFFKPAGFLSFKPDSNEYIIINRDKDIGLSYSGKVFTYEENTRDIRFEGSVNFIENDKSKSIIASAIGRGNMETEELSFTSFMTMDFDVPSTVFDIMGTEFAEVVEELGADEAIEDPTELLYMLAEIIGNKATKAYEERAIEEHTPLPTMSTNLVKPFVFSNLKFKWSEEQKSFYNDGSVGLSNVLRNDLNASFEGYFEIRKTDIGETINLFIKAAANSWYYFSCEEDKLLIYSSNEELNTFVKEKNNVSKAKIGEFQFAPGDLEETLAFVNEFRAVYFDDDTPYELNSEMAVEEENEETDNEILNEEDDGFQTNTENEDDGF